MEGIRIIELPPCVMASSGYGEGALERFDAWFSRVDRERKDRFYPRDFMWFDAARGALVWYYALPDGVEDTEGFPQVDFPGGLYAVAVSRDQDDEDGERVYKELQAFVAQSGCLALDESPERPSLFHVITPDEAYDLLGYRQLDIYVPVRAANAEKP